MAKGNMLLGYGRGSVGDVTFYRAGGSQRARARNRQPNNPRTVKQMTQRSRFANAVKFFKQINTGFFRYAFEDRKTNESDYNAFMRHNVVNSGYIGAQASKIADWPALGLWQLSGGSLPEITAPFPQPTALNSGIYFDLGTTVTGDISTVGELSAVLINGAPSIWRAGDIFTFVAYRATNANTLPTVDTSETHQVYADYGQFILNPDDNTNLYEITANIGSVNIIPSVETDGFALVGDDSEITTIWQNDFVGLSVIHSRNSANGLLVSSSTMVYNKRELPLIAMSDSGTYYNAVIADWQASADAILQGAAASIQEDVVGWRYVTTPESEYAKTPLTLRLPSATADTEDYQILCSSAAAAASVVNMVSAYGENGGSISIVKTINGSTINVSATVSLAQTSSTATVRVGTDTVVTFSRSA